ncbi:F0F1 ATP synthase subunit B [Acidocella sp.]|uniref:F0F1 ATP synthase subunit B family protein n=1 Tax=Acidocella sp. TaxID=50710 RepID=UPI002630EF00|nr:F0F1 ATP synthase subunit B [Acidocella sp.]
MRGLTTAVLLGILPSAALAEGTMPQMDFSNPLTLDQVGWMAVIMVGLYLVLSRWGLPQIGKVIENRADVIAKDLAAARAAKIEADTAVAQLNAALVAARAAAQGEVARAVAEAKAKATADAAALNAQLDARLAAAETQIEAARASALAAIKPVAAEAAGAILLKLTGSLPGEDVLAPNLDAALLARSGG